MGFYKECRGSGIDYRGVGLRGGIEYKKGEVEGREEVWERDVGLF